MRMKDDSTRALSHIYIFGKLYKPIKQPIKSNISGAKKHSNKKGGLFRISLQKRITRQRALKETNKYYERNTLYARRRIHAL